MGSTNSNPTLNIDKTTIGYSKEGIEKLVKEIESRIDTAANKIDPSQGGNTNLIGTLKSELDNYWDGSDFSAFISTLSTASKDLSTSLKTYKKKLTESLNSYVSQWTKFQSGQASQITSTLKIQ